MTQTCPTCRGNGRGGHGDYACVECGGRRVVDVGVDVVPSWNEEHNVKRYEPTITITPAVLEVDELIRRMWPEWDPRPIEPVKRDHKADVKKAVEAKPGCAVCHFAFSKPVTFCPNCGARR